MPPSNHASSRLANDADREHFQSTGYWAAPGLFDPAAMRKIQVWVDELMALPETADRQMLYFETDAGGKRLLNRIENFEPYHAELGALLRGPEFLGNASTLLGSEAVIFKDKLNLKLPGGGGFEPHQDAQAGWESYANLFVTAALAIDDATRDNGCLELARWSHRRELVGRLWEPLRDEDLTGVVFEPMPMTKGDVLFFDSYIPHRSAANPTQDPRRLLYITYNRAVEGDHRARYYADKRKSFPPDCAREPEREYRYRV